MIIKTFSNSLYELDTQNKRARRLHGKKDPTKLTGKDGEWKAYTFISEVIIGESLIIAWAEDVDGYTQPATQTSAIVEINPKFN